MNTTQPFLKTLPQEITSYDLLKSIAVITMIIDHLGIYFFPEQMGWRIVGGMSMPIWLFLIGFANTRQIPDVLWAGGAALLIGNIVVGQPLFPLNILFTIIVVRMALDMVMRFLLMSFQGMFLGIFSMAILAILTIFLFDYGTLALLFAVFGYIVRHQAKIGFSNERVLAMMVVIFMIYAILQKFIIGFDNAEFFTMGAGVILVCLMLSMFKMESYKGLTARLPVFVTGMIKLMGRKTLEIYVVHLLLFKALAMGFYPDRFPLFNFHFF